MDGFVVISGPSSVASDREETRNSNKHQSHKMSWTAKLPARAEGYILSSSAFKMQQGTKNLVVPHLPELGVITAEVEEEYFTEDQGDVFAPVNADNLLN